jgi:hypothetical protein
VTTTFPHVYIFEWTRRPSTWPDWWWDRSVEFCYVLTDGPYVVAILRSERNGEQR